MPNSPPMLSSRAARGLRAFAVVLLSVWLGATAASAQVRVNVPGVPTSPGAAGLPSLLNDPLRRVDLNAPLNTPAALLRDLQEQRPRLVRQLLHDHADRVEADPNGAPMLRGELLLTAPPAALVAAALAQGYVLLREELLDGLDLRVVVLAAPPGLRTAEALARLRALDGGAAADFHHLYQASGAAKAADQAIAADTAPPPAAAVSPLRIGLVDGGIDAQHPSLREARLQRWGCEGGVHPHAHGTAVASLLVGQSGRFHGAQPGAALWAADVYCGQAVGGSAEAVAQALAWMARERVPVVNLSLVGPPNRLLERVVRSLVERGHLLVAAVGNDGPAAPPLYPAAYEGVVGITALDAKRRVLIEAGRGPHVAYAAPGADLAVAAAGEAGYTTARGTSFAAPIAAGLLAALLPAVDPAQAQRAVEMLARSSTDLGAAGRDTTYGWGLVGEALRIEPATVSASARGVR